MTRSRTCSRVLTAYNADGSVVNEVAESIESDDSKTWTVKIKDWKFTDGTTVTAESFVKAWNYGANPENKQLNNYFFYPIEGTDEVGNTTKGDKEVSGLKVVDDKTFDDHAEEAGVRLPAAPRLLRLLPGSGLRRTTPTARSPRSTASSRSATGRTS